MAFNKINFSNLDNPVPGSTLKTYNLSHAERMLMQTEHPNLNLEHLTCDDDGEIIIRNQAPDSQPQASTGKRIKKTDLQNMSASDFLNDSANDPEFIPDSSLTPQSSPASHCLGCHSVTQLPSHPVTQSPSQRVTE